MTPQQVIGHVLRVGVLVSSLLMAVGLALTLAGTASAWSDSLLRIGLLILIATPVANVIVSGLDYVATRDWKFVLLTAAVLLILTCSLFVALMQRV